MKTVWIRKERVKLEQQLQKIELFFLHQDWSESLAKLKPQVLLLQGDELTDQELASIFDYSSVERHFLVLLFSENQRERGLKWLKNGFHDLWWLPMSLEEITTRVSALSSFLKKHWPSAILSFNNGQLKLQEESKQVFLEGKEVPLTALEYAILYQLISYPKRIYSRDELFHLVKDYSDSTLRVIDTHIKNLRKKLADNPKKPQFIGTVHGRGYRFEGIRDI